VPFVREAALAKTVTVAGAAELTEKLLTDDESQGWSDAVVNEMALGLVVDRLTLCAVAACPENALNVRLAGLATSVPLPPPPPGEYVTVTVTGIPFPVPTGVSVIVAVQGEAPQFVLKSWKDNMSGVLRLFALNVVSQKGTPERVYVMGVVPDVVTWIDRAWLSFRPTVVELTINCDCARPGTTSSSAVARNRAIFFSDL